MKTLVFYPILLATLVSANLQLYKPTPLKSFSFPRGFLFGAGTSAYQVEGAWDQDGRGESIWDTFTHSHPEYVVGLANGDTTCNSYQLYKEDVQFYRFSISWSRVLPTGRLNYINKEGINYYNRLIDELLENDIKPIVTLYHWDLPEELQKLGGWTNPIMAEYFEDYACLLFSNFGDRVKVWLTFNEPASIVQGYETTHFPPGIELPGVGGYLAARSVLLAHARAYHAYQQHFRQHQQAWNQPQLALLGLFAHPIYSHVGGFPELVKHRVRLLSEEEGLKSSRLPELSQAEIEFIRGTWDFFGLNHYTTVLGAEGAEGPLPSNYRDCGVVPWGFRKILNWIAEEYNNPPIVITENGYADDGKLADTGRIHYYITYLTEMLKAVHEDGCNVIGFCASSLLDNFEWNRGFSEKFGLFGVDFSDVNRPRIAKDSSYVYAEIIRTRQIPVRYRAWTENGDAENTKSEFSTNFMFGSSTEKYHDDSIWNEDVVGFFITFLLLVAHGTSLEYVFPDNFMLGTGSAAFQIEGAWNESGKGPSIWDAMIHKNPETVNDYSNSDIACDSYHKYKEDVQLIKNLGMNFYRFSISWPRILPTGHVHIINQEGITYYNNLINELKRNGIEPVVTMYHWDLPDHLQEFGGWASPIIAEYFEDYAHVLFSNFGDRVKWWITLQDPKYIAQAYGSQNGMAPRVDSPGIGEHMAMHTLLIAHANAYRLYDRTFRRTQQGKVGIALQAKWFEPLDERPVNLAARDRALQFVVGAFAHPILSEQGDFPAIVKERIARKSREEGFTRSRLPPLSPEEIEHVRGTADFLGLNHYTTKLVEHNIHRGGDAEVELSDDPSWPSTASPWFKVVPWGFRKLLVWIKQEYNNPPVFVTENGYADLEGLHDMSRTNYFIDYMAEMLKAMHEDQCNVIGYTAWSLLDGFEWKEGYTEKYGLYAVNFSDPMRRRIPKDSAYVLSNIAQTRQLPIHFVQVIDDTNMPGDNAQESTSAASHQIIPHFLAHACLALIFLHSFTNFNNKFAHFNYNTTRRCAKMELLLSVVVVLMVQCVTAQGNQDGVVEIPKDFLIGTATSAYQTEGAWNQSGKGLSIWDKYVHENPDYFPSNASGDITADSYHKYKEDVDFYRFSFSWPRILPKGFPNHVNQDGIDYYNKLINELTENNIQCVGVMYHWDLPEELQDLGGWANPVMEEFFEDYARILFLMFGDRIKTWITMVEPLAISDSYNASEHLAPGVNSPHVGKYLAIHTLIKAHARVYRMYHNDFHTQRGKVGIALNSRWFEPRDNSSTADKEAAERALEFEVVPSGIRKLIKWASDKYKKPEILITENGYVDRGEIRDTDRVKYIVSHLSEIMKAKNEDGCKVTGYTVWSLMDVFEWNLGFEQNFGLYKVNRSDPELQRIPKSSAYDLSEICKKRKLPIYFLKVTGEIDVNLTFFDHEKLQNGESVTENIVEASSSAHTNFVSPIMLGTTAVRTKEAKPTTALTRTEMPTILTTTEVPTIPTAETTTLRTTMLTTQEFTRKRIPTVASTITEVHTKPTVETTALTTMQTTEESTRKRKHTTESREISTKPAAETTALITTEAVTTSTYATTALTTTTRRKRKRKKKTTTNIKTTLNTSPFSESTESLVTTSLIPTTNITAIIVTNAVTITAFPVCNCNNQTIQTEENEEKNCGRNPPHRKWLTFRERTGWLLGCLKPGSGSFANVQPTTTAEHPVQLVLYTSNGSYFVPAEDAASLVEHSEFDKQKITIFYYPGYKENNQSGNVIQATGNFNFILVDASYYFCKDPFSASFHCVFHVAPKMKDAIQRMHKNGLAWEKIHLMGFSLGAIASGFTGKFTLTTGKKIPMITDRGIYGGLRVCSDMAVLVNHNGFRFQSGCPCKLIPFAQNVDEACSHMRSWKLFVNSVADPHRCLCRQCPSFLQYKAGMCNNNPAVIIGLNANTSSTGRCYMQTSSEEPYCEGIEGATGSLLPFF
ncbi:hypothetical protein C0J52_03416 [Blattella germanica]|nr:hypothetical protein C0J52_03416 [Blattella germanica]